MGKYNRTNRRGEPVPPCTRNCPDRGGPTCHNDKCEHGWAEYQKKLKEFKRQKKIDSEYARYRRASMNDELAFQAKDKKRKLGYKGELHSTK